MLTIETLSDEIQSLRHCVRDLVALSALPAVWTGREPLVIAESLADTLFSTLRLDIIYVSLEGLPSEVIIEVTRPAGRPDGANRMREIGQALAAYLESGKSGPSPSIPNPIGTGTVRITAIPIGHPGEGGVVVAGSRQPDFPTEMDHLLLRVGANQAAISLQQIRLLMERKEAEAALRESEERFRTLANAAPSIVWTAAPDGTITFANDQWFHYCGLTPQQNARNWPELVLHPDDLERCVNQWTRALELGIEYEIEVRNRRHDGEYRWFLTRAVPVRDSEGHIITWFGTTTDIHDRKQVEEALAEELARRAATALDNARLYEAERRARAEAEAAGERLSLLTAASEVLIASPDYEITLPNLARLIVSSLADWCVVDIIGEDDLIYRLAVVHRDPAKAKLATQLQRRYPALDPQGEHTIAKTLRRGQAWFDAAVSDTRLAAEARDAEHLRLLRGLGFASEIIVPLTARGRTLGALTLVRGTVERRYEAADLTLAELLARRAALAVDNARLYREAQQLNTELEQRVASRTAELQAVNTQLKNEMSQRQRTQAELAELQRRLLENEEANRLYLAQELHDGPVQELYGVSYALNELKGALSDEIRSNQLATTQATVQQVIQMLRATFSELRPPALAPFGLEKAIRSHAEQFQAAHPELELGLNLTPDGQTLPERVRLALFRIYQEALNNIVRHAEAHYILIRFVMDTKQATLEVQDDGRGFEAQDRLIDLARQGHLGLVGISERAEAIGGQLQIISTPGEGTRIRVVVLRPNEDFTLSN